MSEIMRNVNGSFSRRIYSYQTFKEHVHRIFDHMDELRRASRGGHVSHAFAEKIMLVVTAVNGCRYCNYGHSRAALAAGVSEQELQNLLALDLGVFPEDEVVALTFAQHYAETEGQPAAAATERLIGFYGEQTAYDILAYIRMITFGNLLGNTWDALISRFAGKPAAQSTLKDEIKVLFGVLWMPVYCLVASRFRRKEPGMHQQSNFIDF